MSYFPKYVAKPFKCLPNMDCFFESDQTSVCSSVKFFVYYYLDTLDTYISVVSSSLIASIHQDNIPKYTYPSIILCVLEVGCF